MTVLIYQQKLEEAWDVVFIAILQKFSTHTACTLFYWLNSYMYCWLRALESECYLDVDIWVHAVSDKWGTNHDKAPWYVDRESLDTLVGDTVVTGYQLNELVPMFISCAALLEFLNNRYLGRYECLEKKTD